MKKLIILIVIALTAALLLSACAINKNPASSTGYTAPSEMTTSTPETTSTTETTTEETIALPVVSFY